MSENVANSCGGRGQLKGHGKVLLLVGLDLLGVSPRDIFPFPDMWLTGATGWSWTYCPSSNAKDLEWKRVLLSLGEITSASRFHFFFGQVQWKWDVQKQQAAQTSIGRQLHALNARIWNPFFFSWVAWLRLTRQVGTIMVATSLSRGVIYAWGAAFGQILVQSLGA